VHFHFISLLTDLIQFLSIPGMDGLVKTRATIAPHCFSRMSAELQLGEKKKTELEIARLASEARRLFYINGKRRRASLAAALHSYYGTMWPSQDH
jgi:hypothetical protein